MLNVLLFNPRAANHKPRIPNSILQVASSINNLHNYFIIDGNLETDPLTKLLDCFCHAPHAILLCTAEV